MKKINLKNSNNQSIHVLAEHKSDDLSVFIVGEKNERFKPANGGLRLLSYPTDKECLDDGLRLASLMKYKHDIYATGFSGGKVVARAKNTTSIKKKLIKITAQLLDSLNGTMITGCDLNTTIGDMERLQKLTPHVLAAVGSDLDASTATAYGVLGAVESLEQLNNNVEIKSALVHGCGAVGGVVAHSLINKGWDVKTVDKDLKKSEIKGAKPVHFSEEWWKKDFDILIPCSISGLLTEEIVNSLETKAVIPAANAPFSDPLLADILRDKDIKVLPDPLVNAGAVIADSIELFDPKTWQNSNPNDIYRFVRHCIKLNTNLYFKYRKKGLSVKSSLEKIAEGNIDRPIGLTFSKYLET